VERKCGELALPDVRDESAAVDEGEVHEWSHGEEIVESGVTGNYFVGSLLNEDEVFRVHLLLNALLCDYFVLLLPLARGKGRILRIDPHQGQQSVLLELFRAGVLTERNSGRRLRCFGESERGPGC
jgi:hypothetical protein